MKKEIKVIDEAKGIVRITTADERWYSHLIPEKERIIDQYEWIPSVTWITSYYPKGIAYMKWLANHGWDESKAIMQEAGEKGSKIHLAISAYLTGRVIKMDDKFFSHETGQDEELTTEEYASLLTFVKWFETYTPEIIANELTVFNFEDSYAGTLDFICRIGDQIYIIDFKTGQNIWQSHRLQLSAYSHADIDLEKLKITPEEWSKRRLMILRVGYKKNKNGYKADEIEDQFDLFLTASKIWANETKGIEPKQRDYPLSVQMGKPHILVNPKEALKEMSDKHKKEVE